MANSLFTAFFSLLFFFSYLKRALPWPLCVRASFSFNFFSTQLPPPPPQRFHFAGSYIFQTSPALTLLSSPSGPNLQYRISSLGNCIWCPKVIVWDPLCHATLVLIKSRAKATILHRILGRGGKSSSKRTRTRSSLRYCGGYYAEC